MIKILSATQIRALDAFTIEQDAIASIDLMERACRAFVGWFIKKFDVQCRVGVVCGAGNNGGDGAGIARLLKAQGYSVSVWLVRGSATQSKDFETNLEQIKSGRIPIYEILGEGEDKQLFKSSDVLIDALFGTGLSRPATGLNKWVIESMNAADVIRVSIDIPSGLMADTPSSGAIVKAAYTVSFQVPKLSFLLPEQYQYVGEWSLVSIGLSKEFIREAETQYYFTSLRGVRRLLKRRSKFDHKGTYGHALLVAGGLGKMGAAVLSASAALRAGLGLLTVHVPKCGNVVLQSSLPEAMVSLDRNEEIITTPPSLDAYDAVGVGPGLGKAIETVKALRFILENYKKPIVIDADALNIIAENKDLMHLIPVGSILTPHPKEFERLVGKWSDDFQRLALQRDLASRLKSVVLVKGAFTAVAAPDGNVYFNSTGNPGMATGGAGDVLTGILTSFLAQGYDPVSAAVLGAFLHGLSGDLAVPEFGMDSLIASDIITFLPKSFLQLQK